MDGVFVDSEPYICKAAIRMFEELGINVLPEWVRTSILEE